MFLIMSGAYVEPELQSEFGRVPPSFLPLANRRLFQHQIRLAPEGVVVYLSIPESYKISRTDEIFLTDNAVNLLRVPDDVSLGASLVASINLSEHLLDTPLHVLFGDTLFCDIPVGDNVVGVSTVDNNYNWSTISNDGQKRFNSNSIVGNEEGVNTVNGYFKFRHPRQLASCITKSRWSFSEGLNLYNEIYALTATPVDDWFDFGHINTFYKSKAKFTTQRSFNELEVTTGWVEKSSVNTLKIGAEANWFFSLPFSLREFIPQYLGVVNEEQNVSYRLEYLHQTALNELYVFSELPVRVWDQILVGCVKFLKLCRVEVMKTTQPANTLDELFTKKTVVRLQEYCECKDIKLSDSWSYNSEVGISLKEIISECSQVLNEIIDDDWGLSVLHGDFCFSNILYDFRSGRIKTIDPRGIANSGEYTIYGDVRYDIAKLSHSIIGLYDWIVAGYCTVNIESRRIEFDIEDSEYHKEIQRIFVGLIKREFFISESVLLAMQIHLFLSMLPLHNDDIVRQDALFANVFRLYKAMKGIEE